MITLNDIQTNLRENKGLTPQWLAEAYTTLAGEFAFWSGMLEDAEVKEMMFWDDHKGEKGIEVERMWKHDFRGVEQARIRIKLKAIAFLLCNDTLYLVL